MRPEFDLFWSKLFSLIETNATFEADVIINFLRNLDDHNKILLFTGVFVNLRRRTTIISFSVVKL